MSENKKQHMYADVARGKGSGQYSGQTQAATRPSGGKQQVMANHARSGGHKVQSGANAASAQSGKVSRDGK